MAGSYTIGAGTTISAGYTIGSSAFTLTNDGVAGSTAAKYGVFSSFTTDTITNFGNVLGLAAGGDGVRLTNGGLVQNQSGLISGSYGGIVINGAAGTVTNQGSIGGPVRGVELIQGGGVSNASTGTITGNYDIVLKGTTAGFVNNAGKILGGHVGVALQHGGDVTVAPGGTISGALAVQLTGGGGAVLNHGFIGATGGASGTAISMAAGFGNAMNIYAGSTIVGTISGGNTVGGTAFSVINLYSGSGTGTITGLGAKYIDFESYFVVNGDWVLTGTNTMAAGAKLYIDSTLTNSGAVQGIVQLESFSGAAPSLTNALGAAITGTGFGVSGSYGLVGVVNDGLITATSGSGDGVKLTAGGSVSNQSAGTISGGYGGVIVTGAAGTLTNDGSIGGAVRGVELTNGGSVTNASTATITGNYDVVIKGAGGVVNNAGKILGGHVGVALEAGGHVYVAPTGTIIGALAVQLTGGINNIYNHGFIGASAGTSGTAISLAAGFSHNLQIFSGSTIVGTVSGGNTVGGTAFSQVSLYTGTGTGTITGLGAKYTGFQFYSVFSGDWVLTGPNTMAAGAKLNISSTLTNSSALQGIVQLQSIATAGIPSLTNAYGAVITGTTFGVRGRYGRVGLVNDGHITATSGSHSVGVALTAGGSVNNQSAGTIGSAFGVYVYNASGTVTNYGHISGAASATGVVLQAGGTVNNQGTVIDAGGYSYGMKLHAGGVVTNGASAYVSGGLTGIYVQYGGSATITNQGTISGGTGSGVILEVGGTFTNTGTAARVIGGGSGVFAANGAAIVSNQGTIKAGTSDGVELSHGGTVLNAGTIISILSNAVSFNPGFTNLLVVDPGAVFSGTVDGGNTIGATAVSTLELASGASAGTLSGVGTQFIDFAQTTIDAGAAWTLALPSPASMHGSIAGFGPGDTLDLAGVSASSVTFVSGTLEFAGGSFPLALSGASSVQAVDDGAGGALVVACFRAGTRIAAAGSEVPVESLAVGDRVRVHVGGGDAPIVWIGQRHIDCRQHPEPHRVWPVRIARGAFGAGRPQRDLWLSPDHAIFVHDVLIPAKMLINGTTIVQVAVDDVTYYHIELPRHDVLLADGLPVESYLETGDRANFANGGDSVRLFPDFASRTWEARGCAPLVVAGPRLDAVLKACRRGGLSSHRGGGAARSA